PEQPASAEPEFAAVPRAQPGVKCGRERLERDVRDPPERQRSELRDHARTHAICSSPAPSGRTVPPRPPGTLPGSPPLRFAVRSVPPHRVNALYSCSSDGLGAVNFQVTDLSSLSPGQD